MTPLMDVFAQGEDSSHSSPAPAWGSSIGRQFFTNFSNGSSSHGLQLFTNCSSMGPFHGMQSFRNGLLQCGFPNGDSSYPSSIVRIVQIKEGWTLSMKT
ncbi:uncharacterized protein LOC142365677 isoform X3 [Opisthocomus hoazin]|uniref:uncharacterized protein LOC142365677 isoform X3 n=1 Tax=Opisthocomus hoazin TaxID=30419 RepID=UPI003F534998